MVAQADEDTAERIQETSTLQKNFINCCCDKNMAAIIELSKKFALLEAKIEQRQLSPSYEELLAKIKALEDERDSLLTALRLLKKEFDQSVNDHRNNNSQRGNNDAEWQEVKRSRSNPRRLSVLCLFLVCSTCSRAMASSTSQTLTVFLSPLSTSCKVTLNKKLGINFRLQTIGINWMATQ